MRNILTSVAVLFLLVALLVGCDDKHTMHKLVQLETRLDHAPDSVLDVLATTTPPRRGERQALHALLTVLAQEKTGTTVTDDSLINIAVQYYSHRGAPAHRLQAFYCQGRIYANSGLYHEAMMAYTRAKEIAQTTDAPHAEGILYTQMGLLHGSDYDYSQGLIYMEEALRCYDDVGQERLQTMVKREIGQYQLQMSRFSDAEASIKEILDWGQSHDDAYVAHAALDLLLRLYDITGNHAALDSLLRAYPPEALWKNAATYAIAAHHYATKNDAPAAEKTLAQAWSVAATAEDTAILLEKSYQVSKVLGRTDDALAFHESLLAHKDSVVRVKLQQPLAAAQRDYYYSQLEISDSRVLTLRYIIGVTTLVFIIIGTTLWGYHQKRLRNRERLIKLLQDTLQQNQAELHKLRLAKADDDELHEPDPDPEEVDKVDNAAPTSHREAILHIYSDNISTSKALFGQDGWAARLDNLESSANKDKPFTHAQRRALQETLLSSFATVISNLYDEAPNLNDKEVLHCLLSSLGYSSHIIKNCLMASSLDAVRMQKFRMRKKLPPDMFLLFFKE